MGSTSTCLLNVDGPLTSPWTSSVATAKAFHTVRLTMTHKLRPPAQTGAAARPPVLSVNRTPDSPRSKPKPAPSPVFPISMHSTLAPAPPPRRLQCSGTSIRPHGWKPACSSHLRPEDDRGRLEPEQTPPSSRRPNLTSAEPAAPVWPLVHHLQTRRGPARGHSATSRLRTGGPTWSRAKREDSSGCGVLVLRRPGARVSMRPAGL